MKIDKTELLRERARNKRINSPETWDMRSMDALPEFDDIDDGGIEYLIKASNGETIATISIEEQ